MDCLIIDDEKPLAEAICEYFNLFGLSASYVCDYADALKAVKDNDYRMIILDINLGEKSGFKLCEEIRKITNIPVMFLSARNLDDDILAALSIGGDDYVIKPCSSSVLLAKAKAILKRTGNEKPKETVLQIGKVILNTADMTLTIGDNTTRLPLLEYKLLEIEDHIIKSIYKTACRLCILHHFASADKCTYSGTKNSKTKRFRQEIISSHGKSLNLIHFHIICSKYKNRNIAGLSYCLQIIISDTIRKIKIKYDHCYIIAVVFKALSRISDSILLPKLCLRIRKSYLNSVTECLIVFYNLYYQNLYPCLFLILHFFLHIIHHFDIIYAIISAIESSISTGIRLNTSLTPAIIK